MSSIGTGYDLAASTFSPDGRIFQVEYAQKAVDNMGTVLAIRCKDGVVTAVDKIITSKLDVVVSQCLKKIPEFSIFRMPILVSRMSMISLVSPVPESIPTVVHCWTMFRVRR